MKQLTASSIKFPTRGWVEAREYWDDQEPFDQVPLRGWALPDRPGFGWVPVVTEDFARKGLTEDDGGRFLASDYWSRKHLCLTVFDLSGLPKIEGRIGRFTRGRRVLVNVIDASSGLRPEEVA